MNIKELFADMNDELAEQIGKQLVKDLNLKKLPREKGWDEDRYDVGGSSFAVKGVARRIARIFIETAQK